MAMSMSFQKDAALHDVGGVATINTSAQAQKSSAAKPSQTGSNVNASPDVVKPKKTLAEIDAELALKMAELAGDGGMAGVEFEDGQPTSMKRSVRNNMFRYI